MLYHYNKYTRRKENEAPKRDSYKNAHFYTDRVAFGGDNVVPCIIKEVLFAPPCPTTEIVKLLEVALVYHNNSNYQQAIHTYISAQQLWMDYEFQKHKSVLEAQYREEREKNEVLNSSHLYSNNENLYETFQVQSFSQSNKAAIYEEDDQAEYESEEEDKAHIRTDLNEDDISSPAESVAKDPLEEQFQEEISLLRKQCNKGEFLPQKVHLYFRIAIGNVYESSGNDEMALSEYMEAKRIAEELLKSHSTLEPLERPDTALSSSTFHSRSSSRNATQTTSNQQDQLGLEGDLQDRRSVDIPRTDPDVLSDTALPFSCIGSVFVHVGQYALGYRYYMKCREMRTDLLPPNHVDSAIIENNIGVCLHYMNKMTEAIRYYEQAKKVLLVQLGPNHPRTLMAQKNLHIAQRNSMSDFKFEPPTEEQKKAVITIPSIRLTDMNGDASASKSVLGSSRSTRKR